MFSHQMSTNNRVPGGGWMLSENGRRQTSASVPVLSANWSVSTPRR